MSELLLGPRPAHPTASLLYLLHSSRFRALDASRGCATQDMMDAQRPSTTAIEPLYAAAVPFWVAECGPALPCG
jgi:hypothetical protein